MDGKERRASVRQKGLLSGILSCPIGSCHCQILELSESGARIRAVEVYERIDRFILTIGIVGRMQARVVWRQGRTLGMQFEDQQITNLQSIFADSTANRPRHAALELL